MKKLLFIFLVVPLFLSGQVQDVIAQEIIPPELSEEDVGFYPSIRAENSVEVGKNIIFQADITSLPEGGKVREFLWEFGDGQFSSQEEVVHIFRQPGRYNVKLNVRWQLTTNVAIETVDFVKEIFVFERSLFLITDLKQNRERVNAIKRRAEDQNVYLDDIQTEENLWLKTRFLNLLEQSLDSIQNSDTIIIWSDQVELLTVLNSFVGRLDFQQKELVVITDGNIGLLKNILFGVYSILQPRRIIITRREAIDEFFTTTEEEDVVQVIQERGYDFDLIDELTQSEFNFFALPSYGMRYLQEKGVEDSVILLVLFLPVIVTVVTFLRLVIGLSSLGSRMPLIFAFTFLVLGPQIGISVIILLALISYLFRRALFRSHLLYTAKVGVLTSFLGVVLLFVMGWVVYFQWGSFDFANVLMLILLTAMIDRVASVEGEKGIWSTVRVFIETMIIAGSAYGIVAWDSLQILLLSHPEVLVLFIVANIFMGRFAGLRLLEYFRFREVLRYTEE